MSKIHILSEHLTNMIAAGEVVERPAGIVKECVENSIDAHAKTIEIEAFQGGIERLVITDDGCGMDEYTLSKVKEMFFTTKVKGSGLGVSLSNEIIKAHNGSIEYSSKLGKGTKVVVKLPIVVL